MEGDTHAALEDRLWRRVQVGSFDECWEWLGGTTPNGYGKIGAGGRGSRTLLVHRVAYKDQIGKVSDCVLHTCDNRICCNPAHLFDGTKQDNSMDAFNKGRLHVYVGGGQKGYSSELIGEHNE